MTERRDVSMGNPEPSASASGYRGSAGGLPLVRSWWSGRWLRGLGNWLSTSLLATGRLYVRREQVRELDVQVGTVTAHVHEPNGSLCRVRLGLRTFADDTWDRVIHLMAENVACSAHLLNGEIPRDVEELFRAAGVSLFPETRAEIDAECDCAEWSSACNHVAAVLVLLGDHLDEDPFLLFRLRGRAHERVMASLRAARSLLARNSGSSPSAHSTPDGVPLEEPLAARLDDFWEMASELESLQIRVRAPEVELEVVKLLGAPAFTNDANLMERLTEVYRVVSQRAMEVAYRTSVEENTEEPDSGTEAGD